MAGGIGPEGPALAGFGSYYAGGRPVQVAGLPPRRIAFTETVSFDYDPNGRFVIEQAYVQWFRPVVARPGPPLVLLHGGGCTGAMWEATPDGRPGWLDSFLRQGFTVHVVDNVERGRAGWCPVDSLWPGQPIQRGVEEAWSLFRFGAARDFAARRAFPGQRFPIAALDELIRGSVPRWPANNPAAVAALGAVLDRIGEPVLLLSHSQGGEIALHAAAARPDAIAGVALVEPSGFLPAGADPAGLGWPLLLVMGDFLDATPLWVDLTRRTRDFLADFTARGGRAEGWFLAEQGITGNSHMPMMDDNSTVIAERIGAWLAGIRR